MLQAQVEQILDKHDCEWSSWHGFFDMAARKKEFMLLKLLDNVDSFQREQASNLRILSEKLDAFVSVIGTHTRYEKLDDNVIYERFSVPAFTPETLDNILGYRYPFLFRTKGGLFREVNPEKLRHAREKAGLSQSELADAVGVTKKSIYEHEHRCMKARNDAVEEIENLLRAEITTPISGFRLEAEEPLQPQDTFARDISTDLRKKGFAINFVRKSPFNLIAEESFLVLSEIDKKPGKLKRKLRHMVDFSEVSRRSVIAITEKEMDADIPVIGHSELKKMNARDLKKMIGKTKRNYR